jgi:hypothetical protein
MPQRATKANAPSLPVRPLRLCVFALNPSRRVAVRQDPGSDRPHADRHRISLRGCVRDRSDLVAVRLVAVRKHRRLVPFTFHISRFTPPIKTAARSTGSSGLPTRAVRPGATNKPSGRQGGAGRGSRLKKTTEQPGENKHLAYQFNHGLTVLTILTLAITYHASRIFFIH